MFETYPRFYFNPGGEYTCSECGLKSATSDKEFFEKGVSTGPQYFEFKIFCETCRPLEKPKKPCKECGT